MMKRHVVPLLLTSHGYEWNKQSIYSILEDRYQTIDHPVLEGKRILGSAFGWLVLTDPITDDCFLWNPESEAKIQLPQLYQSSLYNRCVLSKPPTEPDCLALFNTYPNVKQSSVCRISDTVFIRINDSSLPLVAISSFKGEIYGIVEFDGTYYILVNIRLVKFVDYKGWISWKIPQLRRSWVSSKDCCMIESPPGGTGKFFLVIKMISGHCVEFMVFQVDVEAVMCVELENLGGYTIFIGDCGNGFCCPSSGMGIKPNTIYYTNRGCRVMYVYDMDDRSTTPLLPCPIAGRYVSNNYWVDLPDILGSV